MLIDDTELICRICKELIKDAVTTRDCRHSFCRACLEFKIFNEGNDCPNCDQPIIKNGYDTDKFVEHIVSRLRDQEEDSEEDSDEEEEDEIEDEVEDEEQDEEESVYEEDEDGNMVKVVELASSSEESAQEDSKSVTSEKSEKSVGSIASKSNVASRLSIASSKASSKSKEDHDDGEDDESDLQEVMSIVLEFFTVPSSMEMVADDDYSLEDDPDMPGPSTKKPRLDAKAKKTKKKIVFPALNDSVFRRFFRCPLDMKLSTLQDLISRKLNSSEQFTLHFAHNKLNQELNVEETLRSITKRAGWQRNRPFRMMFTLFPTKETPPVLEPERMPCLEAEAPHLDSSTSNTPEPIRKAPSPLMVTIKEGGPMIVAQPKLPPPIPTLAPLKRQRPNEQAMQSGSQSLLPQPQTILLQQRQQMYAVNPNTGQQLRFYQSNVQSQQSQQQMINKHMFMQHQQQQQQQNQQQQHQQKMQQIQMQQLQQQQMQQQNRNMQPARYQTIVAALQPSGIVSNNSSSVQPLYPVSTIPRGSPDVSQRVAIVSSAPNHIRQQPLPIQPRPEKRPSPTEAPPTLAAKRPAKENSKERSSSSSSPEVLFNSRQSSSQPGTPVIGVAARSLDPRPTQPPSNHRLEAKPQPAPTIRMEDRRPSSITPPAQSPRMEPKPQSLSVPPHRMNQKPMTSPVAPHRMEPKSTAPSVPSAPPISPAPPALTAQPFTAVPRTNITEDLDAPVLKPVSPIPPGVRGRPTNASYHPSPPSPHGPSAPSSVSAHAITPSPPSISPVAPPTMKPYQANISVQPLRHPVNQHKESPMRPPNTKGMDSPAPERKPCPSSPAAVRGLSMSATPSPAPGRSQSSSASGSPAPDRSASSNGTPSPAPPRPSSERPKSPAEPKSAVQVEAKPLPDGPSSEEYGMDLGTQAKMKGQTLGLMFKNAFSKKSSLTSLTDGMKTQNVGGNIEIRMSKTTLEQLKNTTLSVPTK